MDLNIHIRYEAWEGGGLYIYSLRMKWVLHLQSHGCFDLGSPRCKIHPTFKEYMCNTLPPF
jgi:hypothetical protein